MDFKINSKEFGGSSRIGFRKTVRPFDPKLPLHVVLRSEKALGKYSLNNPNYTAKIESLVYNLAIENKIKIYNFVISKNHLHLLIMSKDKIKLQNYFRELSSKIALLVYSGLSKFWTSQVYTKLLTWGRQFKNVQTYLSQNNLESLGGYPLPKKKPEYHKRHKKFYCSKISSLLKDLYYFMLSDILNVF